MWDKLVTVASFENPAEAYAAKFRLETEGIQACVADETVGNWLPIGAAVGGIKVQVAERDVERSAQILSHREAVEEGDERDQPWRCKKCQEIVDAGFDLCWSCGESWAEAHDPEFLPGQPPVAATAGAGNDFREVSPNGALPPSERETCDADRANPYYFSHRTAESLASAEEAPVAVSEELEALVTRAWRASVIGIVTFPFIFNLYSIWLLLRAAMSNEELGNVGHWKYRGAWAVNLLAVLIHWFLLRAFDVWK